MKFTGSIEELKAKLEPLGGEYTWVEDNPAQKQLRHQNGGIMNWYASTGTIQFQGKATGRAELEASIVQLVFGQQEEIQAATEAVKRNC